MANKSGTLLKQVTRILSPRTSTPRLNKPLNIRENLLACVSSPIGRSRPLIDAISEPRRQKRFRRLTYTEISTTENGDQNIPPQINVYECPDFKRDALNLQETYIDSPNASDQSCICLDTPKRKNLVTDCLESRKDILLGKGSYGIVVKSLYKGKRVAGKIIDIKHEASCIRNEENGVGLKHPNIVEVLKVIYPKRNDPKYGIVIMEYNFRSTTMQSFVGFGTPFLTELQRYNFVVQVASALKYIHEKGIIHLDIKPGNILIMDENICKICDFGSSARQISLRSKKFPPNAFLRGTLAYIAPEILKGELPTYESDIYSLGILMWQLQNQIEPYDLDNKFSCIQSLIYHVVKYKHRPNSKVTRRSNKENYWYNSLYESCWHEFAEKRPRAQEVIEEINEMIAAKNNN